MISLLVLTMTGCFSVTIGFPSDPVPTKAEQAPSRMPGDTAPTRAATADRGPVLTEEEVKQIALDHAGAAPDRVQNVRIALDWDDGIRLYEVEFRDGRTEYEFEIHAETGEILSWERDD